MTLVTKMWTATGALSPRSSTSAWQRPPPRPTFHVRLKPIAVLLCTCLDSCGQGGWVGGTSPTHGLTVRGPLYLVGVECAVHTLRCPEEEASIFCDALADQAAPDCIASVVRYCSPSELVETCTECSEALVACQDHNTTAAVCGVVTLCIHALTDRPTDCEETAEAKCPFGLSNLNLTERYCTSEEDEAAKWNIELLCTCTVRTRRCPPLSCPIAPHRPRALTVHPAPPPRVNWQACSSLQVFSSL